MEAKAAVGIGEAIRNFRSRVGAGSPCPGPGKRKARREDPAPTGFGVGGMGICLMLACLVVPVAQAQDLTDQAQPSPQKTTAFSGDVQAELSVVPGDGICAETAQLTILRRGQVLLDQNLPLDYGDAAIAQGPALCNLSDLKVLDLDGDAEPEIHLGNFSGGAHCCFSSLVYRYEPVASAAEGSYVLTTQPWGNGSFDLVDLDLGQDGGERAVPEWLSRDDRFAYVFASYAASFYPIQIWRYDKGRFTDVSRDYPQRVYSDAYSLWLRYRELRQELPLPEPSQTITAETEGQVYLSVIRSVLAAYMADKYLLGQEADGWQRLEQLYPWGDRPTFINSLKHHLRSTGYITGSFTQPVRFFPGGTFEYLSGRLLPGEAHRYELTAREAQQLQLTLQSGDVQADLLTPGGQSLGRLSPENTSLGRPLPQNGTYVVEVRAAAESSYQIFVEIP